MQNNIDAIVTKSVTPSIPARGPLFGATRLLLLASSLALTACGGSSGGGDDNPPGSSTGQNGSGIPGSNTGTPGGTPGDNGTPGNGGNNNGTPGGNPGGNPGTSPDTNGARLSHGATAVPLNVVDPASAPFFSAAGQARAAALPDALGVIVEVVDNQGGETDVNCNDVGAQYGACSVQNLHIKDADGTLNGRDWKLYFHSIRRILRVDSNEFSVSFVNGDLFYLEPTDNFAGFNGGVKSIKLVTEYQNLVESDFMPRYWVARGDGSVELIANTDSTSDPQAYIVPVTGENAQSYRTEPTPIATVATRFSANARRTTNAASLSAADIQARIIPQPVSMVRGSGSLDIGAGFSFAGTALPTSAIDALTARQKTFMSTSNGVPLNGALDLSLPENTYKLVVNAAGIAITGSDEEALFHGSQSLLALVQPGIGSIPYVTVTDSPRFGFRGMHVDTARNFHPVSTLKRLMDQMAAYKLNRLHLHLTDDEGWRLEIPSLPELTSIGGKRNFALDGDGNLLETGGLMPQLGSGPASNTEGSGFYSRSEFIDLLRYANARFIQVIPEIDMPAHARAAVVAMRARAANLGTPLDTNVRLDDPADTSRYLTVQHYDDNIMNPCIPGTYTFIDTVIGEVKAMFDEASASMPIWHMGGDEASNIFKSGGFSSSVDLSQQTFPWESSPACTAYYAATAGVSGREDLQTHFVKRVSQSVANAGIDSLFAWYDGFEDLAASDLATNRAGVDHWGILAAGGAGNINRYPARGFDTILASPDFLYLDMPAEAHPEERGYYWATRFNDTRKVFSLAPENPPQNAETSVNREGSGWSANSDGSLGTITGIQGNVWSETVRTPQQFDYTVFPRIIAVAERAWHKADWELDYQAGQSFSATSGKVSTAALEADFAGFAAALGTKELRKLDAAGVQYRVPVPGASVSGGTLSMNIALPGLPLEYSTDGQSFQRFTPGTSANGVVAVRALSADGSRAGRADTLQ